MVRALLLLLAMWPLAASCSSDATDADAPNDAGGDARAVAIDAAEDRDDAAIANAALIGDAGDADVIPDAVSTPGDPCAGGTVGAPSDADATGTSVNGYAFVRLETPNDVPIVALTTTLHVPATPPASGTVFIWPGLQPAPGPTFYPIDNGVLQPVLTWGPTCAPNAPASPYASWWVSGQYVNTTGSQPGHTGCNGGLAMATSVGDALTMTITLVGSVWKQKITDEQTHQSTTFDLDMQGQSQNYAEFVIEGYNQQPTTPVSFTSTVITFGKPAAASCKPVRRGATDSFSAPVASPDGTRCCIASITLKANGL